MEELKTEGFDTGNIDFNHMSIEERHKFMKLIVFSGTSERSFAETKIVNQGNLAAAEPEFLLMEPEQSATEEFIIIVSVDDKLHIIQNTPPQRTGMPPYLRFTLPKKNDHLALLLLGAKFFL